MWGAGNRSPRLPDFEICAVNGCVRLGHWQRIISRIPSCSQGIRSPTERLHFPVSLAAAHSHETERWPTGSEEESQVQLPGCHRQRAELCPPLPVIPFPLSELQPSQIMVGKPYVADAEKPSANPNSPPSLMLRRLQRGEINRSF